MESFLIALFTTSVSIAVIGMVWGALSPLLARVYAARWRYAVWLVLFIGLLIPFRPDFGTALIRAPLPDPLRSTFEVTRAPAAMIATAVQPTPASDIATESVRAGLHRWPTVNEAATTQQLSLSWLERVRRWVAVVSPWQWISGIWLAGVLGFLGYHLWRHRRFMQMVRRWSELTTDAEQKERLQCAQQETGVTKSVRIARCPGLRSPVLVGLCHPVILLPKGQIAADDLTLILKHELVHLKHGDLWWKLLLLVATALHWFNPLVYRMARATAVECEMACDEAVLRGMDMQARRRYGETIIGVIRAGALAQTVLSTNFYGGKQGMKMRMVSIMDTGRKKTGAVLLVVALLAALSTGSMIAAQTEPEPTPEARDMPNGEVIHPGNQVVPTVDFEGGSIIPAVIPTLEIPAVIVPDTPTEEVGRVILTPTPAVGRSELTPTPEVGRVELTPTPAVAMGMQGLGIDLQSLWSLDGVPVVLLIDINQRAGTTLVYSNQNATDYEEGIAVEVVRDRTGAISELRTMTPAEGKALVSELLGSQSAPEEESDDEMANQDAGATPTPAIYIVQAGDTILSIAARLDISPVDLLAANGLDNGLSIRVGQVLVLP